MMDNARALTIAGVALMAAALLGLFLVLSGEEEAGVVLPQERASAPTAPSQSPDPTVLADAEPEDAVAEVPGGAPVAEPDDVPVPTASDTDMPAPPSVAPEADADDPGTETDLPAPPPVVAAPDRRDRSAPGAPAEQIVFCFPEVIPVPGDCADRDVVLSLADEQIGLRGPDGGTQALAVELADPAGLAPDRTATTCAQYASLKANDWGPVTTAAMRRDQQMNRFCGLIALARRAAPGQGGLSALTEALLDGMEEGGWPTIGEAEVTNPIVLDTPGDPRAWFVQADRVEFVLRDVASADFDGDGEREVLVFTALQASDGTAVGGGYALAKLAGGKLRLTATDPY